MYVEAAYKLEDEKTAIHSLRQQISGIIMWEEQYIHVQQPRVFVHVKELYQSPTQVFITSHM